MSASVVDKIGNDLLAEHYFSFVVWAHIIPGAYVIEYVKKRFRLERNLGLVMG